MYKSGLIAYTVGMTITGVSPTKGSTEGKENTQFIIKQFCLFIYFLFFILKKNVLLGGNILTITGTGFPDSINS